MRILIAEDDPASRRYISRLMSIYGECDLTIDGIEVIEAFLMGMDSKNPYNLICMDVMMPKVDGIKALRTIRELEAVRGISEENRVRIIITTALGETDYVKSTFETGKEAYVSKPIEIPEIKEAMKTLGLI